MRVLVTGATGFIGRALCADLAGRGDQIVAVSRHPARAARRLPATAHLVGWDLRRGPLPAEAIGGVEAVVNLAGEPLIGSPLTPRRKRIIVESRVRLTENLLAGFSPTTAPRVLVSGSGVNYYGDHGDAILDETAPGGADFLARLCRDWEAAAVRAESAGVRVIRLRTGLVLGREGGALPRLLLPFQLGLGGPVGSGDQWWAWIHRADLVGLILHALHREAVRGPLNGTAPEPVRSRDFVRRLGRAVHRPTLLPVPALAVRLALGDVAAMLLNSQRVVPERALATGYQFRFPTLAAALNDLI